MSWTPDGVPRPRFPERRGNFGDSAINRVILHIFHCACTKRPYFHLRSKIWCHHRVPRPRFPKRHENSGDSRTFKADIGLLNICVGFQDLLVQNGGLGGQNRGKVGAILTPNELVLPFGGSYVCAHFGENWSRNATVRVPTDGRIHWQTQTDFIICPMLDLYAIAMECNAFAVARFLV